MSDVFISHVEEDADIALEIALGLEEAGFTTWCYELNSVPGPSYLVQTGQAVEQCNAFVLLISPHSLGSRQITIEIVRAHECGKDFIPVLRGITHSEFQNRQPEWREAVGSATSIHILQDRVVNILTRIIVGLNTLGIQPLSKPKAARITMIKMALGIHEEEPARPTPKVEAKKTPVPRQPTKPAEGVKVELPECPECGAKPRPNATFCNKCGARVGMGEKES